jgi:PadR family transcriptional regulator, regulatory protein AphA
MAIGTPSLRNNILGLLAQEPMSGYDIKRLFKDLSWLVGSPSPGSLYPILRALLKEGLVTVEVVTNPDRPARKIYSLTKAGRQELEIRMDQPVTSDASLKGFVMHLLLTGAVPPSKLVAHLRQRQAQVAARRMDLTQSLGRLEEGADMGRCLTLEYGLALATAELAWLGKTLARLSE